MAYFDDIEGIFFQYLSLRQSHFPVTYLHTVIVMRNTYMGAFLA